MSFVRLSRQMLVALPLIVVPVLGAAQTPAPAPAAAPAAAPAPTKEMVALARQVVDASGAAASFKNVVPYFIDQTKGVILQTNMDLSKTLSEIGNALRPEFEKRPDDLINTISTVYAQKFTQDELTKILAFYRSPEGKKLVDTMPAVLDESYSKTQEWGQGLSRDLMQRFREELSKKGIKY